MIVSDDEIHSLSCPKCHRQGTLDSHPNMIWD